MTQSVSPVEIIGAGLAGCEAALVLARKGIPVELVEMRPVKTTPAHKTALPAELVCSNSLKSRELPGAQALLKDELTRLNSPLLALAADTAVPAGSALAVDRLKFSNSVAQALAAQPLITQTVREAIAPAGNGRITLIAAGPLASDALVLWLTGRFTTESLNFYDAIAPIVSLDSIDTSIAFYASRWKEDNTDYLNCPFTEEEYRRFYDALVAADVTVARDFEQARFFEACLPVEVIASRGYQSLSFGPLKPVGFVDPRTNRRPYAVCQLRRETNDGDSFSMVAFQTRLTIPGQQQVLRLIPGLEHAQFLRYGSCHRNSFMNSPELLNAHLSFKDEPTLFLSGQLCGNEGYSESIATGHLAALFIAARISGTDISIPPPTTACGALLRHITASEQKPFSPSSFNFGLVPALDGGQRRKIGKKDRHALLCERAQADFAVWKNDNNVVC